MKPTPNLANNLNKQNQTGEPITHNLSVKHWAGYQARPSCEEILKRWGKEVKAMLFIETDSPPPFYQAQLSDKQRRQLDQWYIGHRSQAYYLKRFEQFDKQNHLSAKWHWAAFFVTFGWLLYRKRYLDAIVYSVAGWSFIQLNITIILVFCEYLFIGSMADVWQMPIRILIGGAVWLFWSVMVARWSDAYYYRMARREIADALEQFPKDDVAQKAFLQKEGGVSVFGLGLAMGFLLFVVAVVQVQFLPIFAKSEAQKIIYATYDRASSAKSRVAAIFEQTGVCPVNLPITADGHQMSMQVVDKVAGMQTDCAVMATFVDISFPNRNLNGKKMLFYHTQDNRWRCTSSLNHKQKPPKCMD